MWTINWSLYPQELTIFCIRFQDFVEEAEAARNRTQTSSLRSYQMPSDDTLEPEKELAELAHAAECKKCHRQFCRHKKQMIKHFALCPHAKKLKVSPKRRVICGVCKVVSYF